MVPNPARPLGDITGQVRRTILRPKPQEEWVFFNVPQLVSDDLWQKANTALTVRGRGRGKQGKAIQALLRNRIFCPRCGLPMVVRRDGDSKKVYYYCARHYRIWDAKACGFRKFISLKWDDCVWDCVYALLSDDSWIEQQLASEQGCRETTTKLIDLEQRKITQSQAKMTRVQTGYEESIFDAGEAKNRIRSYQKAISLAEEEIRKLRQRDGVQGISGSGIGALKLEMESLRHRNLESASFEDRFQLMGLLDLKVYPSEDLKTVRIKSELGLGANEMTTSNGQDNCGKVLFAPPKGIRTFPGSPAES
jgi:hypothetical protein